MPLPPDEFIEVVCQHCGGHSIHILEFLFTIFHKHSVWLVVYPVIRFDKVRPFSPFSASFWYPVIPSRSFAALMSESSGTTNSVKNDHLLCLREPIS